MSFIVNWVSDKVEGYAKTGIQAGGTLAGNAVGSVGGLVEGAGKTAANGVTGSVGGVAGYINGYGDTIKRSMSSDGPVSAPAKKTAVKPGAPSTQGAKKALPAAGTPKALPAPSSKPKTPTTAAARKPPTSAARSPAAVSKPAGSSLNKPSNTSGKVTISPQSRPKPAVKTTAAKPMSGPTAAGKDPFGFGSSVGSMKPTAGKGPSALNQRKPSAADPLAMGKDLGQFGKK